MAVMEFKKATKKALKLRIALVGPSGSGKTFTALRMAKGMGGRVALIDTERGSASHYSGEFNFDTLQLNTHAPQEYIKAIQAAGAAGYDVLIIDSLSHAWAGRGGALEQVDKIAGESKSQNSFFAWRSVTPWHNKLIDAILSSPAHVISTMRVKTEYAIENVSGKQVPKKVGLAPIQRDGVEYEFDWVADLDSDGFLKVSKSRFSELVTYSVHHAGEAEGERLRKWCETGEAQAPQADVSQANIGDAVTQAPEAVRMCEDHQAVEFYELIIRLNIHDNAVAASLNKMGVNSFEKLSYAMAEHALVKLRNKAGIAEKETRDVVAMAEKINPEFIPNTKEGV